MLDAGSGFNVNLGLVNQTGSIIRYWPGPNTLGGMEGCPIHLSFDAGVPCSKMGIILFIHSWVHGGGTPMAPGSIRQNNTSHAVDRQSLCLLSLNAQINSSKAGVWVQILSSSVHWFLLSAIEYEFHFNLFSAVVIDQVVPPSRDNISI